MFSDRGVNIAMVLIFKKKSVYKQNFKNNILEKLCVINYIY